MNYDRGLCLRPEGTQDRGARGDQPERQDAQDRRSERGRGEPALCDQPAAQTRRGMLRLEQHGRRARVDKVRAVFIFGVAAYNLVRLPKLLAPTGGLCPTA